MSMIAGLYDMEDTLGSGHFAVVKSARHVFTGLRVAIKVIDKCKLDDVSKAHLYQEVRCMKLVCHPAIIRLYEVIDTQTKLYLIEELGDGGDLYDFIMKHPSGIDEDLGRKIFRQAVSAIQYCHQLHVVHRDLKPENLVFCKMGGDIHVKLTDFGLSRTFMPGEMIESACGSLEYSAPEILLGDSYDPPKVDVWSLGVILYMLICGRSPFASGGANETLTHIMDGRYDMPPHASDPCKDLIRKMLVVNPLDRASLDEVVTHPWLAKGAESDSQPLNILKISDIPREEIEVIIDRMVDGGYGSPEVILRTVTERPFDSVAATFYLLAEAERHRKLNMFSGGTSSRKSSVAALHQPLTAPSPMRSKGHAETGVLQPRRPIVRQSPQNLDIDPLKRSSMGNSPFSSPPPPTNGPRDSPYQDPQYISPRLGVGGEQVSTTNIRKPSFPIQSVTNTHPVEDNTANQCVVTIRQPSFPVQSVGEDTTGGGAATADDDTIYPSILDPNLANLRGRQLSACEEESECDDFFGGRSSPRSPRTRRLLSACSSPNLAKSVSRSDFSDEENEDDDIMELTHHPMPHLSGQLSLRHSPMNSPHLSSRRSPTHTLVYSSDEELHISSLYDNKRKRNSKRLHYRKKKLHPLVRVDSASSDDGSVSERSMRHSLPSFGFKLMNIINCRSVPSTPAEETGSNSFTELLTARRPRSNSARTESTMHDANDLVSQMSRQFELSDGEELEVSCETDDVMDPEGSTHDHIRTSGTILESFSTPV